VRFRRFSFGFEGNSEVTRIISGFSLLYSDTILVEGVVYRRVMPDRDILVCESGNYVNANCRGPLR
jgi:hypothetical protein